jgi:hypothetical protein
MKLKMKCPNCGHWNSIEANKLFIEQKTFEPKVKVFIPMYETLKIETCQKCKNTITEPKTLIRIIKT